MDTKIVICPHCEGTRFCKPHGSKPGCSYCISEYQKKNHTLPLFLVPCAFCNNIGFIHRESEEEESLPDTRLIQEESTASAIPGLISPPPEQRAMMEQPAADVQTGQEVPKPENKAIWWINLTTGVLTALFFLSFLFLCYWPDLFDIRYALIPVVSLVWILVAILAVTFFKNRADQSFELISATVEPDMNKQRVIAWTNPLFRFIFLSIAVNTVLFFVHLYGRKFSPLNSTPVAQMEILPAFFSIVMFGVCIIERWQARKDPTIRIVALAGAAVIIITYLVYLKTSLPNFWNGEILLLLIAAVLGLGVITSTTILP